VYKLPRYMSCAPAAQVKVTYPIVVIKLDVKESSENLSSRHDLPTPAQGEVQKLIRVKLYKEAGLAALPADVHDILP
jgi:hypothetical protein